MSEKHVVLGMILTYWLAAFWNAVKYRGNQKTIWQFKVVGIWEWCICGGWLGAYVWIGWQAYESNDVISGWRLLAPIVLFVAAMTLTQWCYRALGAQWQVSQKIPDTYQLITCGPFKYFRHPIYLGQVLIILACCMVLSEILNFGALLLFIALVKIKAQFEEHSMLKRFGTTYREYMKQTWF